MKTKNKDKDFLEEALKKGKISINVIEKEESDIKKTKNKDKVEIEISKFAQMSLDNLRNEIVEFIGKTNDLDLMKKIEKCSYDKLILLLNIGFSEKAFYDTLSGKTDFVWEDIVFTEKSKDTLNQLLKENEKDKK